MVFRLVSLLAMAPFLLWADASPSMLANSGINEFKAAYRTWDGERFLQAVKLLEQATAEPHATGTHYYWLGAAQFHRMLQLNNQPGASRHAAQADQAMHGAIAALERAIQLDSRHAESYALLGTLYGMKIDGNPLRALRFGPRVAKCQKLALEFGPDNPRVRYLLGMCQFHTSRKPAAYSEALGTLLAAEKLFEMEAGRPPDSLEPRWGLSSCRTFIGRTYELLGQNAQATHYFRLALAEHPADHLASEGLARLAALAGKK